MLRWRRLLLMLALFIAVLAAGYALASPSAQTDAETSLLEATRADLELLANSVFGVGIRPDNWLATIDVTSTTAVTDLWFDNELLATRLFGADVRPETWIGATVVVPEVLIRNVRHDLELSADVQFGLNQRPSDWQGAAPLLRCERSLQNLVSLLQTFYNIEYGVLETTFNFCRAVEADLEDELNEIYFGTQVEDQPLVDPLDLVLAVRGDLERLADETLGLNNRPQNWTNNRELSSPTLLSDTFFDLQLLADDRLGVDERPDGWIGTAFVSPASAYFSLRHDLELLADVTLAYNSRPSGWQGLLPLARCTPLTQQLVFIAGAQYAFNTLVVDAQAQDYCAQVSNLANNLVENPPVLDVVEEAADGDDTALFVSESAFAYLDVAATQYMGVMPVGTEFRPLYRNYSESNMMFVTGEDFALYIDRRWTNLSENGFRGLQTLEGVRPISFCNAFWCSGPGPTPTPTGGGPLVVLVLQTTPGAPPGTSDVSTTKTQVSWSNVRVTYVADNATTRSAQVTLEVCVQPADVAVACEPVTRVFDNATGTDKPVLGQQNGLNVYELRYGYNTNLLIEGETRFSTDVWISDPTLR